MRQRITPTIDHAHTFYLWVVIWQSVNQLVLKHSVTIKENKLFNKIPENISIDHSRMNNIFES